MTSLLFTLYFRHAVDSGYSSRSTPRQRLLAVSWILNLLEENSKCNSKIWLSNTWKHQGNWTWHLAKVYLLRKTWEKLPKSWKQKITLFKNFAVLSGELLLLFSAIILFATNFLSCRILCPTWLNKSYVRKPSSITLWDWLLIQSYSTLSFDWFATQEYKMIMDNRDLPIHNDF